MKLHSKLLKLKREYVFLEFRPSVFQGRTTKTTQTRPNTSTQGVPVLGFSNPQNNDNTNKTIRKHAQHTQDHAQASRAFRFSALQIRQTTTTHTKKNQTQAPKMFRFSTSQARTATTQTRPNAGTIPVLCFSNPNNNGNTNETKHRHPGHSNSPLPESEKQRQREHAGLSGCLRPESKKQRQHKQGIQGVPANKTTHTNKAFRLCFRSPKIKDDPTKSRHSGT